jgi:2,5-furandicarboxylate decarboxylase 1
MLVDHPEPDTTTQQDLRSFLRRLETTPGEGIAVVSREVDPVHELSALVKRMEGVDPRAVRFNRVRGHDLPVVMNLFGTKRRVAIAMGLEPDLHPDRVMAHFIDCLSRDVAPVVVESGPVKEVVRTGEDVALSSLPIGVHAAEQGGRYITSGVLLVRDPHTAAVNAGIYRIMVHGERSFTVSVDPGHDLGKVIAWGRQHARPVEFAVVIGSDPTLSLASQAKVPMSRDVYGVMGSLAGAAIPVVRGETVSLHVPATAEIVLEGRIDPGETAPEGPFGEFSYYYGSDPNATLCHVTAITRRPDALYADIHPVHPDHRCLWLHPGREASLLMRLRELVPSVRSAHLPLDGAGMVALISIDKQHNGDPRRALLFALSSDVFIKHAVIVDADVDVHDPAQVVWALAARFQPDRDVVTVSGVRGYSEDPSGYGLSERDGQGGLTSKIGYDATMPLGTGFPIRADEMPEQYADLDLADYVDNPLM